MQAEVQTSPNTEATAMNAAAVDTSAAPNPSIEAASVTVDEEAVKRAAAAEAARDRAAKLIAERKFAEAKKAIDEAEALESPVRPNLAARGAAAGKKFLTSVRERVERKRAGAETTAEAPAAAAEEPKVELTPVDKALKTVALYSKIGAAVGLLPGGVLNFAGVLAVQVTMVWKIANAFGHKEGKDKIRGSILSLVGSVLPGAVGHGVIGGLTAAAAGLTAGVVFGLVAAPVLAYALTQAVGKVFIMHFESGGTLLTFDPKAFKDYFVKEFENAKAAMKPEEAAA